MFLGSPVSLAASSLLLLRFFYYSHINTLAHRLADPGQKTSKQLLLQGIYAYRAKSLSYVFFFTLCRVIVWSNRSLLGGFQLRHPGSRCFGRTLNLNVTYQLVDACILALCSFSYVFLHQTNIPEPSAAGYSHQLLCKTHHLYSHIGSYFMRINHIHDNKKFRENLQLNTWSNFNISILKDDVHDNIT